MKRWLICLCSVAILATSFFTPATAADNKAVNSDAKPLRYKVHIGQELIYTGESDFQHDDGSIKTKINWKLLPVRQNPDGGCRMLIRQGTSRGRTKKGEAEVTYSPEKVSMAWCDLAPDGCIADNPTLDFTLDVRAVLPQLPKAGQTSWQCDNSLTTVHDDYKLLESNAADADHIRFEDVSKTPTDEIYLSSKKSTFSFDVKRGLVDQADAETAQGYGVEGRGTTRLSLSEVAQVDPNIATFVAVEMTDYFAVKQEYEELLSEAEKDATRSSDLSTRAKAILEDLRATVQSEIFQSQLDADLKRHDTVAKHALEQAQRFAAVVGQPSPTWQTTDLAGNTRSIEDCRGKVVVLDFWYRGCGWCIRAMPQIKQLAAHCQGQPVEVFGMNTDDDQADARFVVEKLALSYPTLKADGLDEKYGVRGFPTLLIIDQAGTVREVHVGYSPTLGKSVTASIDKLLAETAAAK
ncbi:MAG TPA: TlpA disulfide reductase family protein [Pirellulales bacterium]|jgi:thiol-disulfide isomerase/thioredoxin